MENSRFRESCRVVRVGWGRFCFCFTPQPDFSETPMLPGCGIMPYTRCKTHQGPVCIGVYLLLSRFVASTWELYALINEKQLLLRYCIDKIANSAWPNLRQWIMSIQWSIFRWFVWSGVATACIYPGIGMRPSIRHFDSDLQVEIFVESDGPECVESGCSDSARILTGQCFY